MGPVRQSLIQRTVRTAHLSVLMSVHNFSTQYSTEQFWWSPLLLHNHRSSDVVYRRKRRPMVAVAIAKTHCTWPRKMATENGQSPIPVLTPVTECRKHKAKLRLAVNSTLVTTVALSSQQSQFFSLINHWNNGRCRNDENDKKTWILYLKWPTFRKYVNISPPPTNSRPMNRYALSCDSTERFTTDICICSFLTLFSTVSLI